MSQLSHLYDIFLKYNNVTTDSRQAGEGSIFFALKGDNFDGNAFAGNALAKGCPVAVVDSPELKGKQGMFYVKNVLNALQELSAYHRQKLGIPIIGITGTNGKTTTKELVNAVLSGSYNVCATKGNLNNHIGVPLTILGMDNNTRIGIVEMGANHKGEIKHLCSIVKPDIGLITNIGKAHLEGFGGKEGVIQAKKELYDSLNSPEKTIFFNGEDDLLAGLLAGSKAIIKEYGESLNSLCRIKITETSPTIECSWSGDKFTTNLAGVCNKTNIEAACVLGLHFGLDKSVCMSAVSDYKPTNNRSQWVRTDCNYILCDYYNANPSSMGIAVKSFLEQPVEDGLKKLIILGDMFELGDAAAEEHAYILDLFIPYPDIDVIVVGNNFYNLAEYSSAKSAKIDFYPNMESLCLKLADSKITGCQVLLKASRGMCMEKLLYFL